MLLPLLLAALVASLGADGHGQREAAEAALAQLLPLARSWLEAGARGGGDDAEVKARCRRLLGWPKAQAAFVGRWDARSWPWSDMIRPGHPLAMGKAGERALANAREAGAATGADWPDYRMATRVLVLDLFAQDWTAAAVEELLIEMEKNETAYRAAR